MTDGYEVARCDQTVYVRVHGLANMKNTPVLDEFLNRESEPGPLVACIDLGSCRGMDSTFMGTLVGHHHRLGKDGGKVVVVNPSPGNRRLLDMLGVSTVLPVIDGLAEVAAQFVTLEAGKAVTPVARAELMKTAHEHLIKLNDDNRSKFGPFLEALEKDLSRLQTD
ncbi:MAG: STAS domain-containing protein [Planctomycetota bacterium]|jgi:anti-sigma B factor antagonist|nr:STAS domain-containing protein [Planctomycetota bacterium]